MYTKKDNHGKESKGLGLARLADDIPAFYVLAIDKIANEYQQAGKDVIKLNLGKSEVPMPKYVADEMVRNIYDGIRREMIDPQGLIPLREEIAHAHEAASGVQVSPDNVFINNGTSPFFLSFFLLLADPGDEILLPLPYYPTYVASANMARLGKSFYRIENGRVNMDDIRSRFVPGKTKIVFLNSPGNPLGNVHTKEELREILDIVDGRAYVISDEIYDGFVYGDDYTSILSVYNPARDKVIVVNGFSKIHHMYTRRLGYAIVPEELTPALLRYQQHTLVCVDPITQFAGLVSMKNKERLIRDETKTEVEEYRRRLHASERILRSTHARVIPPAGSFYMCLDVSGYLGGKTSDSLSLAKLLLNDAHVAITPAEDFGGSDFFRVSLTSSRVVEGIERIADFFAHFK